ncbi:hypothetical protein [Cellulosimicrobium funkei]|uniref:hypothetical protein n=1 Tax=Cellulosimicrobium funkei TaxID=264251 RepID=UPI0037DC1433
MPLRIPKFLDTETFFALADYADIEVPLEQEITERTVKNRKGGGKLGFGNSEVGGERGSEIEVQTSYTLAPNQKAAVSKVLDKLVVTNEVFTASDDAVPVKDRPYVLEGTAQLTTASIVGKIFYVLLQAIASAETSLEDLQAAKMPASVQEGLKSVYLGNELVPIPTLFEVKGTGLEQRVLLSVPPGHFVDAAAPDHIEGEIGLLGTVETLVDDGEFINAEKWLLHGWEWIVRRNLMVKMDDTVAGLAKALNIDLPVDDVQALIPGPAIVLNAVAIY